MRLPARQDTPQFAPFPVSLSILHRLRPSVRADQGFFGRIERTACTAYIGSNHMLSRLLTFLLLTGALFGQSTTDKAPSSCHRCDTQSFAIHAKDGANFNLTVQFREYRWGVTGTHWYRGDPVFVQYNHSFLQADHVTYHKRQRTIEARIGVVLEDSSGKKERFDGVLLKIENGTLTPVKLLKDKEHSAF
jgi:ribosomal protein L37E